MNIQVLTDAPGGYVSIDLSEVTGADRRRAGDALRLRFRNGDFVVVSGETARDLGRLGILSPD
jgi:hypothetical protein